MKKSNYFLAILAVLFSFTACNEIPEPPYPQPPRPTTVIFNETFGNPAANTDINTYTGFVTTGIGSEGVVFHRDPSGGMVDVRNTSVSNFLGASGDGNVLFNAAAGGTLFIQNIGTRGARNLVLSFATNQDDDIVSVYFQVSGADEWTKIPFTKITTIWGLVSGLNIALPEGTEYIDLRFRALPVTFGARIDDVRITTEDTTLATIALSTTSLSFTSESGSNTLTVSSNRTWTAVSSDPANFAVTTAGNVVTVTATENTTGAIRTASITLSSTDGQVTRVVDVTQAEQTATLIFNETFGTGASTAAPWTDVADWNGFQTTGIGASAVEWVAAGDRVTVRGNQVSSGYPGASGGNNVMLAAAGATLYVNNIAVCGAQNLILSFGTNVASETLSVAYSIDSDGVWNTLTFTKTTTIWGLVDELNITLPAGANTVNLRFTATNTQFGTRIDDITIVTYDATSGC